MESKKRRHLPDAFKREAVDGARTSGLTIIQVAEGLGLHETVLRRWIRRFDPPETGPVRRPVTQAQGPSPADLAAENDEPWSRHWSERQWRMSPLARQSDLRRFGDLPQWLLRLAEAAREQTERREPGPSE